MRDSDSDKTRRPTAAVGSRERILRAALVEFAENGLAGARVDQIASEAGVNKAMIYYHFSSKENLYRDVIEKQVVQLTSRLRRHISSHDDIETIFTAAAETYADAFSRNPRLIRLLLRELANPDGHVVQTIATMVKESGVPDQLLRSIAGGIEKGELRRVDVRQALVSFICMNIGYFLLSPLIDRVSQVPDHSRFITERKSAIVDLFLNGARAK